jgi:GT2 family glycosyltransferase
MVSEFGSLLQITVLTGDGSMFWGGAVEAGMRRALELSEDSDLVMTLNDDVILEEDFLERAVRVKARKVGALVGGISCAGGGAGQVAVTGWRMQCWPLAWTQRVWWPLSVAELKRQPEEVMEVDFLPGTATLVEAGVIRQCGPVNGQWLPHYHADGEFSYRLKRQGVRVLVARDLQVEHNLQSTGSGGSEYHRVSVRSFLGSFFSIRSGNSLKYKWRFAKACCPAWAIPSYLVCDTVKALVRGGVACLLGGRHASAIKRILNRF